MYLSLLRENINFNVSNASDALAILEKQPSILHGFYRILSNLKHSSPHIPIRTMFPMLNEKEAEKFHRLLTAYISAHSALTKPGQK